MKKLGRKI